MMPYKICKNENVFKENEKNNVKDFYYHEN